MSFLVDALPAERTIVTCHDIILMVIAAGRMRGWGSARIATRVFRHAISRMNRAAAIIAVSERTRRDLAELADIDPACALGWAASTTTAAPR